VLRGWRCRKTSDSDSIRSSSPSLTGLATFVTVDETTLKPPLFGGWR
jgi:hypothetical protein